MAKRGWSWWILSLLFLSILSLACGGGDSSSGPDDSKDPNDPKDPNEPVAAMSARVDGADWMAQSTDLEAEAVKGIPGGYRVLAVDNPGVAFRQIVLDLYNIGSPGTYPFGVTASIIGAYATYQMSGARIWHTAYTGEAGTVTLSEVSAERLAGTFQFSATPMLTSPATGTVVVTEGTFDVPISGVATPVMEGHGSVLSADLGGNGFNASSVIVTAVSPNLFFNGTNDTYDVAFSIMDFSGPGEYPLSFEGSLRSMVVIPGNGGAIGSNCCWGTTQDDFGTISVSRADKDRIVGTFSVTLHPASNSDVSEPLVISEGVFDVGRSLP